MSTQHSILARTTTEPGRYVIEGHGKALLSDSAMIREVPSIAPGPLELLVAALGSCAVASAEADAREHAIPFTSLSARVTSTRDEADETRFSSIHVEISAVGVAQEDAGKLLGHLLNQCPIFNTLRRGGDNVTAEIKAIVGG